jgi:hypothetical protein
LATQTGSVILRKQRNVNKYVDSVDSLIRRNFVPAAGSAPRPLLMGIDPGLHGAVAVVDMDRRTIIDMIDMPLFQKPTEARKSGFFQFLDVHKLSSLLDMYAPLVALAVLEEPGAMPEQGLSSTFRFGHVCGQIHGVLAGHYMPVAPVRPAVWKSALALSSIKDESRVRASMEFPAAKDLWQLAKQNDRAEAALLCTYAQKYLQPIIRLSRK